MPDELQEYRVATRRTKLIICAAIAVVVSVGGLWILLSSIFVSDDQLQQSLRFRSPVIFGILGMLLFLFSGYMAFLWYRQIRLKGPAPRLDATGLFVMAAGVHVGEIPWGNVRAIEEGVLVGNEKVVFIKLHNHSACLNSGGVVAQSFKADYLKRYGTPIFLSEGTLAISHAELYGVCKKYHARYG